MTNLQIGKLAPDVSFGVRVGGLEESDLADKELTARLRELWIQHGVMVFEGVEGRGIHLALSRIFGELMVHPTREAIANHKELITVRFRPETGWLMSVEGELRGMWLPWHSDLIYFDKINRGGILRPLALPRRLGDTGFVDKIKAYESLPDLLKQRIEGLSVIYKYDFNPSHQKFGRTADVKMVRISPDVASIQNRLDDFPRVLHPMVYEQRETGRKVLNVSPWFAVGIQGMENVEGDALLEEVTDHIVRVADRYIHKWRTDDMVLWDNWRVLHSASGTPADKERWMERTTIAGDYGLGRPEDGSEMDATGYISI